MRFLWLGPFLGGAINIPFIVLNWRRPIMVISIAAVIFCWGIGFIMVKDELDRTR